MYLHCYVGIDLAFVQYIGSTNAGIKNKIHTNHTIYCDVCSK